MKKIKGLLKLIKNKEIRKGEFKFRLSIKTGGLELGLWNWHFISTNTNKFTTQRIYWIIVDKLKKLTYEFPTSLKEYKKGIFKVKLLEWEEERKK